MNISDINVLLPEQVGNEMTLAVFEKRNYFNFRHRLASGEIRDVEVYSGPVESGERILLYSIIHDITDRKRSEVELANSQLFLDSIIEHSPNSLWISDEKGTLIRMNKACRDTLFIEDDEVVGKYNILQDNVIEEQGFMPLVKSVFEKSETVRFIITYDTSMVQNVELSRNRQLILDVNISPILDSNGKIVHAIIQHSDITTQILAEQAIRDSEQKYHSVFSTEKDALFLIDKETNAILEVNESACLMYGYSKEEILNLRNFDLSEEPEDTKRLTQNPIDRIALRYHKKKDGTVFPIDISASQFNLKGRQIILAAIRDISESKVAENALRQSEERFRTVVNWSSNAMVVHREGKIVFVNPAAVKMFGATSSDDLVGFPILERIHPDFHHLVNERIQNATEINVQAPKIEIKYLRLDGSIIDGEVQGALIMFDGLPAIQVSIFDITERKQKEEQLEKLSTRFLLATRAGGVGIWDFDIVKNQLTWDDQMFTLYGMDRSEFGGAYNTWLEGVHPDDITRCKNEIQMALSGEKDFDTEFKILRQDGTVRNIRAMAIVQRDHSGNPLRMIGTNWDITVQKQTEMEIILKNEELQQVNAEKDKFFSVIAHDLRSPFSGFLGLTEVLIKEFNQMTLAEINEILLMLNKSATTLFSLITNLLEWSRMQRGAFPFSPVMIALKTGIPESQKLNLVTADAKGVKIDFQIPESLSVFADVYMFESIMRNLVTNAIKFTPKGGNILILVRSDPFNTVEFSIRDSGIGMSKELVNNLFRLDSNKNRKGTNGESSTGLGLIICKDFIEKHGGKLWVESEEGVGSTFRFTLSGTKNLLTQ